MTSFTIDRDVPPPAPPRPAYPFATLGVGDSFFVPGKPLSRLTGTIKKAGEQTGFGFSAITRSKGGAIGTRVWRVE